MKRGLIYGAIIAVVFVAIRWGCDRRIDDRISAPVLGPNDQAKVILDPSRHTVTTVQRSGTTRTYLPPRTTAITVDRDGNIKFSSRAWGTEQSPFIGFAYSDKARVVFGVNLLYYHQWEGGVGLASSVSGPFSIRLALLASYNVYSNTSLFVGITHTKEPIGGIAFRF